MVPGSWLWAKPSFFLHKQRHQDSHLGKMQMARHLSSFASIDGQYWISVYRSAVLAFMRVGEVMVQKSSAHDSGSTHAKAGTPTRPTPSSLKSIKSRPRQIHKPMLCLGAFRVRLVRRRVGSPAGGNLRSQFYSQTARRRKDCCRIGQM